MKKYERPQLTIVNMSIADIIQVSEEPIPLTLKTAVNGKEGVDYGSTEVSLLD